VSNAAQIHYLEVRPIRGLHQPRALPITTDCSGFVTLCFAWAGAADPNGLGYDGSGYTGTLLSHCVAVKEEPQIGDLVIFGPGNGEHVATVINPAQPVTLVSHGTAAGPHEIALREEAAMHHAPIRFVRSPQFA
jgi:hypothetical protein